MDTSRKTGTATIGLEVGVLPYYRLEVMTVGTMIGCGIHATAPAVTKADEPTMTIRYEFAADGRIHGLIYAINGHVQAPWIPAGTGDALTITFPRNADIRLVPFEQPDSTFASGAPVPPSNLPSACQYGANFPTTSDATVTISLQTDYGGNERSA